jgi:DNA replication protein DnaC
MLVGGVGTGKSIAMSVLSSVYQIQMLRAPDLIGMFLREGEKAFWDKVDCLNNEAVILDDLFAERDASSYGNANPLTDWLCRRYARWQTGGPELHISSNATEKQLSERYGCRVIDRLKECCRIVPIHGASMRTAAKEIERRERQQTQNEEAGQ